MRRSDFKPHPIHKLLLTTTALAALSACASAPIAPVGPLTAGGPSSHTPQSYEPMASTAAITSTLGGSVLLRDNSVAALNRSVKATTGSWDHGTGRLEINDGTYVFVDPDGVSGTAIADAVGATGVLTPNVPSEYNNLRNVYLNYTVGGIGYTLRGVIGNITDAADIPVAGIAHYTGFAYIASDSTGAGSITPTLYINTATSSVDVDFAAGLVNVDLSNFIGPILGAGGAVVTPAAAAFDQVTGTGMVINGAHFTGGNWVTLKNGVPVDLVGAGATASSDGTLFGYDPTISAPDEVGGVFLIQNATGYVRGSYVAD